MELCSQNTHHHQIAIVSSSSRNASDMVSLDFELSYLEKTEFLVPMQK